MKEKSFFVFFFNKKPLLIKQKLEAILFLLVPAYNFCNFSVLNEKSKTILIESLEYSEPKYFFIPIINPIVAEFLSKLLKVIVPINFFL